MSDTTVYFVETKTAEQTPAVCRWVEHFYNEGRRVQVLAGSAPAAQNLDQLLWTFAQGSFIPHRIIGAGPEGGMVEPVIITTVGVPVSGCEALICDGPAAFDFMLGYQWVVHFVLLDDAQRRQESRALWQRLRDRGIRTIHVPYAPKGGTAAF